MASTFLAILALSGGIYLACRVAKVGHNTVTVQRKLDAQVIAAQEHAIELLHDVTMKSAIEGQCEPVFWQGIPVGHIKKVDNRLRVELLCAHMPKTFKPREQRLLSKQEAIAKTCSSVAPMKFNSSKTCAVKPWNGWKRKRWRCPSRTAD
jgi:hypothetical protein